MLASQRPLALDAHDDGPLRSGPTTAVALFHGLTSGTVAVRPWAEALAAAGADVEAPLLPGHGTRWQDLERVRAEQWRAAAREVVDRLLEGHERVVVAGLSMGAALALDAAAHRPVAGTIVVNPAVRLGRPIAALAGVLHRAVRTVGPIANDVSRPGVDERAYPRTPVAAVGELQRLMRTARAGLSQVSAPVLAFRSRVDHVVPESSMSALRRGLDADLLTVRRLEHSFHVATLDWDAARIERGSVEFIEALAAEPHARRWTR